MVAVIVGRVEKVPQNALDRGLVVLASRKNDETREASSLRLKVVVEIGVLSVGIVGVSHEGYAESRCPHHLLHRRAKIRRPALAPGERDARWLPAEFAHIEARKVPPAWIPVDAQVHSHIMAELVHRDVPVKAIETQDMDLRHRSIEKRAEWRWKDYVNRWVTASAQLFN